MNFIKSLSNKNADFYKNKQVIAAFLGDSVTQGCFEVFRTGDRTIDTVYDYEHVYHNILRKMFNTMYPMAPLNIINAGLSGGSAPNGFERLERDVLTYSPDLVVVCFGLNDANNGPEKLSDYEMALRNIFRRLKREKVDTVFLTPNMMNTNISPHLQKDSFMEEIAGSFMKTQNEGIMDLYMDCAKKVCTEEKVAVCDCYSRWRKLSDNGVNTTELLANYLNHPSRDMHKMFAAALFELLMYCG